jgi:hypothetical protein
MVAFVVGVVVGVLGMVPRWWRQRQLAQQQHQTLDARAVDASTPPAAASAADTSHGI